jgi:hypothetical protein
MDSRPTQAVSVRPPNAGPSPAEESTHAAKIGHASGGRYGKLAIILLILNAISASLFIGFVKRPVFDDPHNFPDVQRYASEGVSVDTIRRHINPTGPTSFIWMAAGVRMLGGDGLRDARIAILFSWLLLGAGMLIGARYASFPELWYAALVVTLVFPHTLTATATVLTEGPAMLFAMLGVLVWVESVARPVITPRILVLAIIGGLSIGLAITCRQYYLALLPAGALFAVYQWRGRSSEGKPLWLVSVILSLAAAIVPVLILFLIWKGLSSPGMVSGMSYGRVTSKVGLNLLRPIVATFYTALYLIPLTFPAMLRLRQAHRLQALVFAALCGIGAGLFRPVLLQPGPLRSLVEGATPAAGGESILFGLFAAVAAYSAFALGYLLWEQRASFFACSPAVFALLAVVFFIGEQAGVGGNIPFFELYVLQIAPFLGLIAFALLPRLTLPRLSALACLSLVSHALLWRYALRG